ncbi:MAG TPA: hypothetical protein VHL08_08570 [Dongiaceae bacterium]|jgi:hypothetical protein|nr:hypothetical protein [Dongiaceae bacterium]
MVDFRRDAQPTRFFSDFGGLCPTFLTLPLSFVDVANSDSSTPRKKNY